MCVFLMSNAEFNTILTCPKRAFLTLDDSVRTRVCAAFIQPHRCIFALPQSGLVLTHQEKISRPQNIYSNERWIRGSVDPRIPGSDTPAITDRYWLLPLLTVGVKSFTIWIDLRECSSYLLHNFRLFGTPGVVMNPIFCVMQKAEHGC